MKPKIKFNGNDSVMIETVESHDTPYVVTIEKGMDRKRIRFDDYREASLCFKNEYKILKNNP